MQPILTDARSIRLREGEAPIAGFRLVRRLGRGGFGEVWEAEAAGGFLVALKFVRLSARARAAEVRALEFVRHIHHPNLLANFGAWMVDDMLVIGMELADRSLWDRFVELVHQGYRGIPRAELLGYLGEVAAGLDHLNAPRHAVDGQAGVGIQHRDLKPPNILLFGGGAKVADLGMARAMEGEVAGHSGIWTFAYAAPEFFRGETTHHSDQYGLAATFCQLRGGRLPFGGGAASVTAGHLFGQPDLAALPAAERPIVERALAKAAGDRWPSCRAFIAALAAVPAAAAPEELLDPAGRPAAGAASWIGPGTDFTLETDTGPPETWAADSRWGPPPTSFGPTTDPSFGLDTAFPADSDSPPGETPTRSPDSTPTLILPAGSAPPAGLDLAGTRMGRRHLRHALAAATTALVVATVALQDRRRDAAPAVERSVQAPESTPEASPIIAPAELAPAELAPAEPPGPPVAEPPTLPSLAPGRSHPEPVVPVVVAEVGPTLADLPAPSGQGRAASSRVEPVLEGPFEMPAVVAPTLRLAPDPTPAPDPRATNPPPAGPPARPVELARAEPLAALTAPERVAPLIAPHPEAPSEASPTAPAAAEAAFARGRAQFRRASFSQAVVEFDEALRLNPGHPTSLLLRAIARHRAGDPRAALDDYSAALRARPDDVTAYISRGQAFHELKDFARAVADYDEAIRRRPGDGDARFRRGLARFRSGDYAGSIGDFTATLNLEPANAYAAELRSEALARHDAQLARASGSGVAPGSAAVREARLVVPAAGSGTPPAASTTPAGTPGRAAAPPGRGAASPNTAGRRQAPPRRLLPWPFARAR